MAQHPATTGIVGLPPGRRRALLAAVLRERMAKAAPFPLSPAQEGMWIQQQLAPHNAAYNMPLAFCLRGPLRTPRETVSAVLRTVVQRHGTLRTVFGSDDGVPWQKVADQVPVDLPWLDLGAQGLEDWRPAVGRLVAELSEQAFDLARGPLFRFRLVRIDDGLHVLLATFHHIVMDGWSIGVFLRDFAKAYLNLRHDRNLAFDALPIDYAAHVGRVRAAMAGERGRADVEYWRRRLEGAPACLELPVEFARPRHNDFRGAIHAFEIPAPVSAALEAMARRHGATTFMAMLATFYALLARISAQDDVVVGVSVSNREERDCRDMVGLFSDVLPMRGRVDGEAGFLDLLARVRRDCIEDYEHASISLTTIIAGLRQARATDRNTLFQAGFDFQNTPWPSIVGDAIEVLNGDAGSAKLDLNFSLSIDRGVFRGTFEYNTHLFSHAAIARIECCYQHLLEGILANPDMALGRLPLGAGDHAPRPALEPAQDILQAIDARIGNDPEAIALHARGRTWRYADMDRDARRLAAQIRSHGVEPGDRVGLQFEREPHFVVAMLAALRAGAVYVPIDSSLPPERRERICRDAGVRLILASAQGHERSPSPVAPVLEVDGAGAGTCASDADDVPCRRPGADVPAYIVYTSGSSGEPKGVVVGRGALAAFATAAHSVFGIRREDRVQQFAPIGFDTSAEEIYPALLAGATLVFPDPDSPGTIQALLRGFAEARVTVLNLPTSLWHEVVRALECDRNVQFPECVRLLVIGGEAANPASLASWQRLVGRRVRLLNTYGPTETTVSVAAEELHKLEDVERRIALPIGRPYPGVAIHILDAHGAPVPPGQYGEICIGGPSVALGYHGRPELSAAAFVPDPFAAAPGARMYRSGDFGRRLEDGSIEFGGRRDGQVKLRGFRVELSDVEAVLARHPGIYQAGVAVEGDAAAGTACLVAAVVAAAGRSPPPAAELKAWLGERLPAYMVPARLVAVERLRLTPNGKLDRNWVARTACAPGEAALDGAGPVAPEHRALLEIWRETLGVPALGIHDDFFESGGHSLLLIRLLSAVQRTFGVEIPLGQAFGATTVASMAPLVEALRRGGKHADHSIPRLPRVKDAAGQAFRQSHAQQRLWFLYLLDPGSNAYNNQSLIRLRGPLDVERLRENLTALVERHEILRTVFRDGASGPEQVVVPEARPGFELHDLRDRGEDALRALVETDSRKPFDLRHGPLLRLAVACVGKDEHVLVFNWHHIVTDAWSLLVFVRELDLLRAHAPLAPLPVQYADYAEFEAITVEGPAGAAGLAYWREHLAALPGPMFGGMMAPGTGDARSAVRQPVRVDATTMAAVQALAMQAGATPFMVCLAAYKLLLGRMSGREDIVVGTPVSMRGHASLEGVLGYFINTLVMRTGLHGAATFRDVLDRIRDTAHAAFAHRHVPYEAVVRAVAAEHGTGQLFDASFVFENRSELPENLGDGRLELLPRGPQQAKFPLTLALREDPQGLVGEVECDPAFFGAEDCAAFAEAYMQVLSRVSASPEASLEEVGLLPGAWLERVRGWGAGREVAVPGGSLDEAFEVQARARGEVAALEYEGVAYGYGELNARANRLAHCLRARGVGPESTVGICLPRSASLAVAILAVWKAGGAYVPLDPENPPVRLRAMVEDAQVCCVVGESARLAELGAVPQPLALDAVQVRAELEAAPSRDPQREGPTPAGRLAYVLFTSGSSGRPKGVRVEHGSVMNLAAGLDAALSEIGVSGPVRWAWNASYGFDASLQALVQWRHGSTLHLLPSALRRDPARLRAHLAEHRIQVLDATPLQVEALLDTAGPALPALVVGGEAIDARLWARIAAHYTGRASGALNVYGPTEATVDATAVPIRGAMPRIGRPLANVQCLVLDAAGREQPVGWPGELYIGGAGVARGYAGRGRETAERFVTLAGRAGRYYRSGDRVRWCADGMLEYLGRLDGQVKVNGYRIEPEEVAQALRAAPGVGTAAVVARTGPGGKRLVGYVVAAAQVPSAAWEAELLAWLRERLPGYMVPAALVRLDRLPTTANGKLDVHALPEPAVELPAMAASDARPTQRLVARIWAKQLGVPGVGLDDDFFELGGQSLLAARTATRIASAFGVDVPLRMFFDGASVRTLSAYLCDRIGEREADAIAETHLKDETDPVAGRTGERHTDQRMRNGAR